MISRTPWTIALTGALTGALGGCDPVEAPAGDSRAARARAGEGAGALASGSGSGLESGRPKALRRGRLLAGERVERVPVWPASSAIAALRERLPGSLRAAVDRCPVPVLLPNDVEWLARARVFTGGPEGPGYTLAAAHAGLHLSVQASRVATLLPHVGHVPGKHRVRGAWGFLGENEGIHTASWIEHGVAYTAELECEAPDGPACQRERLVALVEGLEYVGGVGAVGGAL